MTYQDLRTQYPEFVFDKYSYTYASGNLNLEFHYSFPPNLHFTHKISFLDVPEIPDLDWFIFNIGLSDMFSYWKLACSPKINIAAGNLFPEQTAFWQKLFIKGMGEYFYKNQIDFTAPDFISLSSSGHTPSFVVNTNSFPENKVIVPIGGGKDSVVTLELLKPQYSVVPYIVNPVPVMFTICHAASLHPLVVTRQLDPQVQLLNSQGFLNGHVPISAMYAFTALLAAHLTTSHFVAFSNERSSSEGNTTYLQQEINHQYSKTLEFETDFSTYIKDLPMKNFSLLRPLYELQITKLFSAYHQYFSIFTSCNQNFKLNHTSPGLWCGHCPKCLSTALLLACFIGVDQVKNLMGIFPPDLPENQTILQELLGKLPVKPFECVLTRAEAVVALAKIRSGNSAAFTDLLSSWFINPNLPSKFSALLKNAYDRS